MSLRIRRGLNSQRSSVVLDTGEIAWATDTKKLYVGDGSTAGGVHVLASSVDETSGLAWDNTTQKIKYTGALGSALSNVVEDITPQLGGNLDLNNKTINGTGTINFTGNISATALSLTTGLTSNLPLNSNNITGTGNISITGNVTASGTLTATTGLGANLPLNSYNITGTGGINITGGVTATGVLSSSSVSSGQLVLNRTLGTSGIAIQNQGDNNTTNYSLFDITVANNVATANNLNFARSRGTIASPVANLSGDGIMSFAFYGTGSTGTILPSAFIGVTTDGTITSSAVPGLVTIYTTNALGVPTQAFTVNSKQISTFNGMATLKTYADESAANTAVGTPANGMMYYDSGANTIKGYGAGAWHALW